MTKLKLTILLLLFGTMCQSQIETERVHKYPIWFYPSNATNVHGILVNVFTKFKEDSLAIPLKINGIELNMYPLGLVLPSMYLALSRGGLKLIRMDLQ